MLSFFFAAIVSLQQQRDVAALSYEEHVQEAIVQFQQSVQTDNDRLRFWNALVKTPAGVQPTRSDLSLVAECILNNDIAPWLTPANASLANRPPELWFLDNKEIIWSLFEADLILHPFSPPSIKPPKVFADSAPGGYAAALAWAIRQQARGSYGDATSTAKQVYLSEWAPSQMKELADIVLNATDASRHLSSKPVSDAVEGKFTAIVYLTPHPLSQTLLTKVRALERLFRGTELVFREVHLDKSPERNHKASRFGCHLLPQAVLVGPDRIPVALWSGSQWLNPGATWPDMNRHPWVSLIWSGLGGNELSELRQLKSKSSWFEFRDLWRSLRRESPTAFSPRILSGRARYLERPFLGMLLLAAETNNPPKVSIPRQPEGLHERMVLTWYRDRSQEPGVWADFLEEATRNESKQLALDIADALLDLGIPSDEAASTLIRLAQKSRDWRVRSSALRALEFQETTKSPKKLSKFARNQVWQIRLGMTEAMRGFHHPEAVAILIKLLDDDNLRIRISAAEGLRELTGAPFGQSALDWTVWWNKYREGFEFPGFLDRRPKSSGGKMGANQTVSCFGLDVQSDRILFLVDKSESMVWYGKWPGLIEEMEAFLLSSPQTLRFNVIEFSDQVDSWKSDLQSLNDRAKKKAIQFLKRSSPYGPTNLWEALDLAFEQEAADTIVLVSDGESNRGDIQKPEEILNEVKNINRYTRMRIHTIYLWRGQAIPYEKNHNCQGTCPPPSAEDSEQWKERMRNWLPSTLHGGMLAKIAEEGGGTSTIGFGKPWHERPP